MLAFLGMLATNFIWLLRVTDEEISRESMGRKSIVSMSIRIVGKSHCHSRVKNKPLLLVTTHVVSFSNITTIFKSIVIINGLHRLLSAERPVSTVCCQHAQANSWKLY